MAAIQQFVTCVPGQWTQVCQYLEGRRALIVQVMSGDAVFAINTSGPIVGTPFGALPCGIFSSLSDGTGPARFEITAIDHGDLVIQEWYVWVPAATPSGSVYTYLNQDSGVTVLQLIILPGNVGEVAVWEMGVYASGGGYSTVTTTGAGGTPFARHAPQLPGVGHTGYPTLWTWPADPAGETVTITLAATGDVIGGAFVLPDAADISQVSAGSAANVGTWSEIVTGVSIGAWILWLTVVYNAITGQSTIGDINGGAASGGAGIGTLLLTDGAWTSYYLVGVAQVTTPITGNWGGTTDTTTASSSVLAAFSGGSSTPSTVAAVFQSFDLQEPIPAGQGSMMRTGLPKLSPGGVAALVDLQKRLGGQPENHNASTDTQGDV